MQRLLFLTSVCALIILSLPNALASAFGTTLQTRSMQGFVDCLSHCYGPLSDGNTRNILDTMKRYGYQYVSTNSYSGPEGFASTSYAFTSVDQCDAEITVFSSEYKYISLVTLVFSNCNLRLGELLMLYGDPVGVTLTGDHLFFADRTQAHLQTDDWFTKDTVVESVGMFDTAAYYEAFEWQGIAPRRDYCEAQPEMANNTC